jgi:hypothetical protein
LDGGTLDAEAVDTEAIDAEAVDTEAIDAEAVDAEAVDAEAVDGESDAVEGQDVLAPLDEEQMEDVQTGPPDVPGSSPTRTRCSLMRSPMLDGRMFALFSMWAWW